MTTHCVFGAGLIGGYLAGALLACDQTVSVVARSRVQAKLKNGLTLTDLDGNRAEVSAPRFVSSGDGPVDFLWLTVKCTAVESVVAELQSHAGLETVILCCQNGLGSEQAVKDAFPSNTVLRVMVPFNVAELADNHLHRGSGGALTLEYHPGLEVLVDTIKTQLLPIHISRDIQATLWAKLQLNLINPINALADIPVRAMLQQRGYRRIFAACMRELLQVAKAKSIILPKLTALPPSWLPRMMELPDWLFRLLARPMLEVDPTVKTSMWWDLNGGKPTEIAHLNGAVVTHGVQYGIPTPVNQEIVQLVREVEQGCRSQGFTAQQLLRELDIS